MHTALTIMRSQLSEIDGVKTCKIGLETGISPDDYPIIRIVPSKMLNESGGMRKMDALVYFGAALAESDQGLEAVYSELFSLESSIIAALHHVPGYLIKYADTITDEDRLEHFKIFASRFTVTKRS